MTDPLPPGVHRHPDVQLDLAHLERCRVIVAQEVPDQAAVLVHLLGAGPVRYPGRLHDGAVVAQVVDDPDEALVEHAQRFAENRVEGGDVRS